jgi:N-acetylglutamate synthase-like GNAT family acetyltransferase
VRRANLADAPAITRVIRAAYAHYPERIGARPRPMDDDYERVIRTDEVWVTAGAGGVDAVLVLAAAADHLFVENVAVAPSAQGAGRGRALLAHAEARAAELRLQEVRLLTHRLISENRSIYEHLGWERMAAPAEHRDWAVYYRKRVDR